MYYKFFVATVTPLAKSWQLKIEVEGLKNDHFKNKCLDQLIVPKLSAGQASESVRAMKTKNQKNHGFFGGGQKKIPYPQNF